MSDPYAVAYLHRRQPSTPSSDLPPAAHSLPKPPPQKKNSTGAGTGKGKGSVRAKSGCYTCRIRRKKCDEQRDANDNCQTCVRLRLECLGFGTKRPDWMRENNSVPDLREKIKQFLASQGMIKGHSGSGSRNIDSSQTGPILMLSEVGHTKPHTASSGGPQAANATSGARSAGSSAASSPQSPRSPPVPPSTLYHQPPPPPSHYSPPHSQNAEPSRYPHVNTSYARDHRSDMMPYSPISPADLPTPATATSTAAPGLGHTHGHGHDPYNSAHSPDNYGHRQVINSQDSLHTTLPPVRDDASRSRAARRPPYTDSNYGGGPMDVSGRRSPKLDPYYYHQSGPSFPHQSPVSHSQSSYSQSQSYPSSLHPNTSSYSSQYHPVSPSSPNHPYYGPGSHNYSHPSPPPLDIRPSHPYHVSERYQDHYPHSRFVNRPQYSPQMTPTSLPPPTPFGRGRTSSQYSHTSGSSVDHPTSSYARHDVEMMDRSADEDKKPLHLDIESSVRRYANTMEGTPVQVQSPIQERKHSSRESYDHTSPVNNQVALPPRKVSSQYDYNLHQVVSHSPDGMDAQQTAMAVPPSIQSTLSPLYTHNFDEESDSNDQDSNSQAIVRVKDAPDQKLVELQYMGYYVTDVLNCQYALADKLKAQGFLTELSNKSKATRDAMCLLSALHMHCMWRLADGRRRRIEGSSGGNVVRAKPESRFHDEASVNFFYKNVKEALGISHDVTLEDTESREYTEGDAMAGLHTVSGFLFSGGRGQWPIFLEVAMRWVNSRLTKCNHSSELLTNATDSERFITRTTFWFDVWGSITQRRQPRFMKVYRELFGSPESSAYIGEVPERHLDPISMVNIIGCSNYSFRAMAEIANLSFWRDDHIRKGTLSVNMLVDRANDIAGNWLSPNEHVVTPTGQVENNLDFQRRIASEVFRASARVYLHMVLSQAYPQSPEIKEGVAETIALLKRIPHGDIVSTTAIVRSVISAICICGCLTEDKDQMEFFLLRLDSLGEEADLIGNCWMVKHLIKRVWKLRMERRSMATPAAVDWRDVLLEDGPDVPLLV